jgi:hypothetical protein
MSNQLFPAEKPSGPITRRTEQAEKPLEEILCNLFSYINMHQAAMAQRLQKSGES